MNAPLTREQAFARAADLAAQAANQIDLLSAMLKLSEAVRAKLLDENLALKALPSSLFAPRSASAECRQYEREAFAKGLHLAAVSLPRKV